MKTKKYTLYIAFANPETIKTAMDAKYARIRGGYALVYTSGKRPDGYRKVDHAALMMLPGDDREWLNVVEWSVLERFAEEHKDSVNKGVKVFADRFDAALKTAREEMEAEKNGN
ncbi:MAG: hypothetical protein IJH41_01865 [Eubacterium sp.]|nr:hypothetical protein [Eubacterium sp.]